MRLRPARLTVTSVLLLIATGCGQAELGEGWAGTVETLPSGAVRVVNPAEGLWESGGAPWRLVPELVLGEIEGPDEELFAQISGLEVDEAGRIYVLDRQLNELRIFSPDGTHVRTVGRSGEGPGEYAAANGLEWLSPDTLLVIDQRGSRYSVLTKEGEYVRSVSRRLGFYGWAFGGGYRDGRIYELFQVRVGEESHPALLGTSLRRSGAAAMSDSAPMGDGDPSLASSAGDTVMLPSSKVPLLESFSVQNERGGMFIGVPFGAKPVYHLSSTGDIWHGHGSEPRIFRSSFSGDTISEVVLQAVPMPVTSEEVAEWEAGRGPKQFREMGGKLDMGRIPKVKPFFDDLYVDPDGYLWLSIPAGPAETVFAVVDPDGRYLGRLQVDGIKRDVYTPPVVRNGRLHMVGRDELGVQRVYGFRIARTLLR